MDMKREREDKEHQPARSGPSIPRLQSSVGIPAGIFSSSASDPEDEAAFGRLVNITAADLVALGSRIREPVFKAETSNEYLVETLSGSLNLLM